MSRLASNSTAKATAVRLLSRRDHSVFELDRKLKLRNFAQEEIEEALQDLIQRDYLSDSRFSEAYIHIRKQKGFGPMRISAELRERGVDEAVYRDYLYLAEDCWLAVLKTTYQSKYRGSLVKDIKDKAKRIRFMQSRGFALDAIYQVLDSA